MKHSQKEIIEELKGSAPLLAELKSQLPAREVKQEHFEAIFQDHISTNDKASSSKRYKLIGIAASILLVACIAFLMNPKNETNTEFDGLAEFYIDNNLDEIDNSMLSEIIDPALLTDEFESISDQHAITYLEANLEDLELELFFD